MRTCQNCGKCCGFQAVFCEKCGAALTSIHNGNEARTRRKKRCRDWVLIRDPQNPRIISHGLTRHEAEKELHRVQLSDSGAGFFVARLYRPADLPKC